LKTLFFISFLSNVQIFSQFTCQSSLLEKFQFSKNIYKKGNNNQIKLEEKLFGFFFFWFGLTLAGEVADYLSILFRQGWRSGAELKSTKRRKILGFNF